MMSFNLLLLILFIIYYLIWLNPSQQPHEFLYYFFLICNQILPIGPFSFEYQDYLTLKFMYKSRISRVFYVQIILETPS